MPQLIRVLIVEESAADAELLIVGLRGGGFDPDWRQVESVDSLRIALGLRAWDIVLSAYSVPQITAAVAMEIVHSYDPDLSFIVVSDAVGEEAVADIIRAGARDYILKPNVLRLAAAVERELKESGIRRVRRIAEFEAQQLAAVVQSSDDAIVFETTEGVIASWNPGASRLFGWSTSEVIGKSGLLNVPEDRRSEFLDGMSLVRETGIAQRQSTVRCRKDGSLVDVSVTTSPVRHEDGQLIGFSRISRDITSHKRLEIESRLSMSIIEYSREFIGIASDDQQVVFINQAGRSLVGLGEQDEIRGSTILDYYPEHLRKYLTQEVLPLVASEGLWIGELPLRNLQTGQAVQMEWQIFTVADPITGSDAYFACVARNITERLHSEAEQRRMADLLRAVSDGTPDAVFVKDRKGRYLLFNPAAAQFVGRTVAEVLGRDDTELFSPEDAQIVMERDRRILESNQVNTEEEELTAAGMTRTYLATKAPYRDGQGNIIGIIGISRDITDRKRIEAERDKLLSQLQLQIEQMPIAYIVLDANLNYTGWNPEAEKIFGFTAEEILGQPAMMLVPPEARAKVDLVCDRLRAGDIAAHSVNLNLTKDGRLITCEWHNIPLKEANGEFIGILAMGFDVTEQFRVQEALRVRDRAIRAVTLGIVITDVTVPGNPIIYVSPGFEQMTGYTEGQILGRAFGFLQGDDTDLASIDRLREAIHAGEAHTVELLNYRQDGTPFWDELSISPVRDASNQLTHFVEVHADVTSRRRLEEQFRQAQKMEAFGQLAGGVAHDFNNLLTVINGYSDLLLQDLPAGDPSRELLIEIHRAGERSAALTRQLLMFSRKQILTPRILNLNFIVVETEKLLRRLIGEDICLKTVLHPDLWTVRSDPGQIEQMLLNFVVNARDAMPTGGQITIATQNVTLSPEYVANRSGAGLGPHVLITVTDTGSGMTPEVCARIFEPFFTTKQQGKGTGLGLATVYGIVRESGGHIEVDTEQGHGTTFKVYFPRRAEHEGKSTTGVRDQTAPRGTETILIVEDEDGVRGIAQQVLQGCGYIVLTAAEGLAAMQIVAEYPLPIHLLLSDVVMPGIGGLQVAERVIAKQPQIRVLFVSGYTDDAVVRHGIMQDSVNFLQKPFSSMELAVKVRQVLDAPPLTADGAAR